MNRKPRQMGIFEELIVDNFAGGGGASTGIELALGRPIDIAINHDPEAISMHQANHPFTEHYCESVWDVDPIEATGGKPVGLAWFSPDCTHYSRAKGGKPVSNKIRCLPWIVLKWAVKVRPRIIMVENVAEIMGWGRLDSDGRPIAAEKGRTFQAWINAFRKIGYAVEYKTLVACDFGTPTSRERLFVVMRCDGEPITWPTPTHAEPKSLPVRSGHLKPHVPAATIIDWSLPMLSIFERKKPLADNTLRRIAHGIRKFVIETPEPFIVTCNHSGDGFRGQSLDEPFKTITAARDAHGLLSPVLIQTGWGERKGQRPRFLDLSKPLGTAPAQGVKHAIGCAWLLANYGGKNTNPSKSLEKSIPTITTQDHNWVVAACLDRQFGTARGASLNEPVGAVMGDGGHTALVAAFLLKYYGDPDDGEGSDLRAPCPTITVRDRMALNSVEYIFADILLRMLKPPELYAAQGFPKTYIIAPEYKGKPFTQKAQVKMCGNSVPPQLSEALVRANYVEQGARKRA
jgi:DNA (cytosine-5)-methyltransferase 1